MDILLPQVTDFSSEARMHERHARMDDGSGSGIILILSTVVSAELELERQPPPAKLEPELEGNQSNSIQWGKPWL